MGSAKTFFSEEQKNAIIDAIAKAELDTSGEVRVHIENICKGDVVPCATKIFEKLGMHKTKLRNAVLFYLAVKDRKFAILGDSGINEKVPADFWNNIKHKMEANFREQKFTEGLCEGISLAGQQLKAHFPHEADDKNELANEVTFGKK